MDSVSNGNKMHWRSNAFFYFMQTEPDDASQANTKSSKSSPSKVFDMDPNPDTLSETSRKRLIDITARFAEGTSMQGVPFIKRSNRWWSRLFWTLALFLAIAATAGHLSLLITRYYSWPYSTSINLEFTGNLEFPSVTICNLNPIRLSMANGTSPELSAFLHQILPKDGDLPGSFNEEMEELESLESPSETVSNIEYEWTTTQPKAKKRKATKVSGKIKSQNAEVRERFNYLYGELPMDVRFQAGHQAKTFIRSCSFNGFRCSYKNFSNVYSPDYGNCFTFNDYSVQELPLHIYEGGKSFGLEVSLYLESFEYAATLSPLYGAAIAIHKHKTMAFPGMNGLLLPAGFATDIALGMINVTRLGLPYENCSHPDQFSKSFNAEYTKEACITTCYYKTVADRCGCYLKPYESYYTKKMLAQLPDCDSDIEMNCAVKTEELLRMGQYPCTECISACREINYQKTVSSSVYPSTAFYTGLMDMACSINRNVCQIISKDNEIESFIKQNFLQVNVYYESLVSQHISQVDDYDLPTLVSDVGGTLGLWLGISILTIVEIMQFTTEICRFFAKNKSRNEEKPSKK